MKGVILAGCPGATLVDVSHSVPPFDLRGGAFVLWAGTHSFRRGAVHLAVVDPGVGSERRGLALEAGDSIYVGPDNGIFELILDSGEEIRAFALRPPSNASRTFEGRDVFAPAAAALAAGAPLASLGEPVTDLVRLADEGPSVVWVDAFGNLVTNLRPPARRLLVAGHLVDWVAATYAEAPAGRPFCYIGSMGFLEVAVREGRADLVLEAAAGSPIELV